MERDFKILLRGHQDRGITVSDVASNIFRHLQEWQKHAMMTQKKLNVRGKI